MKNGKPNFMDTKSLVKAAFLVALSIVLTRFVYVFIPGSGSRISLGDIPLMMSGLLFGPLVGGISGLAADLIGVVVNPQGVFHPGFTLSSISWGFIPGLYYFIFRNKSYEERYSFKVILLVVSTCFLIISLGFNTLWLSQMQGKAVFALLPFRVVLTLINIPLQSIIMTTLFRYLKRIFVEG